MGRSSLVCGLHNTSLEHPIVGHLFHGDDCGSIDLMTSYPAATFPSRFGHICIFSVRNLSSHGRPLGADSTVAYAMLRPS